MRILSPTKELVKALDERIKYEKKTRSALIEAAVWAFIESRTWHEQSARDLDIINRHARVLNREARGVPEY